MKTSSVIVIIVLLIIIGAGLYYANRSTNLNTIDNTLKTSTTTGGTNGTTSSGSSSVTTGSTSGSSSTTSTASTTSAKNVSVDIRNFAFNPTPLTIKKGTKVTWTNNDTAPHTVTSVSGTELDSPRMTKGQTYAHTFNTAGTFNYYCAVHPNMKATVIVTE